MALQIHTAPPGHGTVVLGRTLPSLLDEAVERHPNPRALNQPLPGGGWKTLSNAEFRDAADEVALGLLALGLERGDKVAFFMNSDLYFALFDFGCLVGGLINVPLYTTFARENLVFVTEHAEAKAMVVSNPEMLGQLAGWVGDVPAVRTVILAEGEAGDIALPEGVRLVTLDELRGLGRERLAQDPEEPRRLREQIGPKDLATLIYTSGTTGRPKGVMLTHENISSNIFASFSSVPELAHQEDVALSFLPMTHILARMLVIAHIAWGHQLYFSDPERLVEHLPVVRPSVFASVPRVLEKVYDKVSLGLVEAEGLKRKIGTWALDLAKTYETGKEPAGLQALQLKLADKLVYSKLRERLGLTRVKALVIGGAALRPDLCDSFNAFGIPVLQGYGLTETSPVITVNTLTRNRAGTVGPPIPGIEVAIAEDGEILTRGPHVMLGYYKEPERTAEVLDEEGWLHTGDIGEFTPEGFLRITDRKKALFKLSTGKYVMPSPIENRLLEDPLIEQAVVVGAGHSYSTALLFPNQEALAAWAKHHGIDASQPIEQILKDPRTVAHFEALVTQANEGMDPWSQVKRFKLLPELMTVENELLTPTMKVKRSKVAEVYRREIDAMYGADIGERRESVAVV